MPSRADDASSQRIRASGNAPVQRSNGAHECMRKRRLPGTLIGLSCVAMGKGDRQDSSVVGAAKSILRQPLPTGRITPQSFETAAQEIFLQLLRYDTAKMVENPQACFFEVAAGLASGVGAPFSSHRASTKGGRRERKPVHSPTSWLDDQREIELTLLTLSEPERQILKLQFFEELNDAEITNRLGVSGRVVTRALAKGCHRLLGRLVPRRAG